MPVENNMSWLGELLAGMGGRKLVLNGSALVASVFLLVFGFITADHWIAALGITVGGYTIAEGAADAIGRARGDGKSGGAS